MAEYAISFPVHAEQKLKPKQPRRLDDKVLKISLTKNIENIIIPRYGTLARAF